MAEVEALDATLLAQSQAFHAVRADLLRRAGRLAEARAAYDALLGIAPPPAERLWLLRRRAESGGP